MVPLQPPPVMPITRECEAQGAARPRVVRQAHTRGRVRGRVRGGCGTGGHEDHPIVRRDPATTLLTVCTSAIAVSSSSGSCQPPEAS